LQLWAPHKNTRSVPEHIAQDYRHTVIDNAIIALVDGNPSNDELTDKYELWRCLETKWIKKQYFDGNDCVCYWLGLRHKYPRLYQLAIDVLTIPAGSCECERMFSEWG
jgi:hypothetical protein